jgi:hypothetical protein
MAFEHQQLASTSVRDSMYTTGTFRASAALLLLIVSAYYVVVTSAGTLSSLLWHTDYYDLLAQGFAEGHLYVPVTPSPKLLALADPFDSEHDQLWLWDASLFNGHFYMYFGPTPGLVLWAFKVIANHDARVFDQWLVLFFMLGRLYAGAALILSVAGFRSERPPHWVTWLAIAVFALASPTPYFMARPVVYEAAISGGQCFLFWGLVAAFWGLARQRWQTPLFISAGLLWGLALGSRGSLILVTPMLAVLTAWAARKRFAYSAGATLRAFAAVASPIALSLIAYGIYNYQRFDSATEFGLTYQLTSRPFTNQNQFFLPNLVSYLWAEIDWSCRFPFVQVPMHQGLTHLIEWPPDYDVGDYDKGERVAGVLVATTWCWLLLAWVWRCVAVVLRRASAQAPAASYAKLADIELWLLLCSFAIMTSMLPVSRMYMANMRFLQDGAGGLLIASMLAGFWLLRNTARANSAKLRALARVSYAGLAAHSIFVGTFLGFTGYMDNFGHENPKLYETLTDKLSLCDPEP